jgi:DNA polymerase-1
MNIPRGNSSIKKVFVAPPGWVFIDADYKQLEVRTAAWYADDDALIEACKGDIHWEVAKQVFKKQIAEIEQATTMADLEHILMAYDIFRDVRQQHHREPLATFTALKQVMLEYGLRHNTKYITFGIIYGREAKSLAEGELHCSVAEAQRYINNFYLSFPKLAKFIKQCQHNAIHRGWLETPTGRRRRFPFVSQENKWRILKQAPNMPIQSWASDICLEAFIVLEEELRRLKLGRALFTVHDAINSIAPEDRVHEAIALIKQRMERKEGRVEFLVDFKTGKSWGTCTKYRGPPATIIQPV